MCCSFSAVLVAAFRNIREMKVHFGGIPFAAATDARLAFVRPQKSQTQRTDQRCLFMPEPANLVQLALALLDVGSSRKCSKSAPILWTTTGNTRRSVAGIDTSLFYVSPSIFTQKTSRLTSTPGCDLAGSGETEERQRER